VLNTPTFRLPFLFCPQETFLPLPPYFTASHIVMACCDYERLEQQYEAAVRLWTELLTRRSVTRRSVTDGHDPTRVL
jgi:hypothetical protein